MPSQKNNITRALKLLFGKTVVKLQKKCGSSVLVQMFW